MNAISNPRKINQSLVDAQQARRILDRLVGYKISPILWRKVKGGLSAGRVQSVALRLIAEREKEINDFMPKEFYKTSAVFNTSKGETFSAKYLENISEDSELNSFVEGFLNSNFKISSVKKSPGSKKTNSSIHYINFTAKKHLRKLRFFCFKNDVRSYKNYMNRDS